MSIFESNTSVQTPATDQAVDKGRATMKRRILVIEDDPGIREGIIDTLQFEGYDTFEAWMGKDALDSALKIDCDLILLDLVLPGIDGLDILREVRSVRPTLPVIIMTARGDEADRIGGLKLGADDYVVKPFSVHEMLARIEAVLRRSAERPRDITDVEFEGGKADFERREIRFEDGQRVELSDKEVELLRYLACHVGRAISREELLSRVWRINPNAIVETRTIDMHIARLREKLRDPSSAPRVILTVRGKGYMLAETNE